MHICAKKPFCFGNKNMLCGDNSPKIDKPQAKFQSQSQSNPKGKGNLASGLSLDLTWI